MTFKVIYTPDRIGLTSKGEVGRLRIIENNVEISELAEDISIPVESIRSVELFRLHGTGRMLKVCHVNGTFFVAVVRFSLFGYFCIGSHFGTASLHRELKSAIGHTT